MWVPASFTPDITSEGISPDVLGCFTDGRMLVIYYDGVACRWMHAFDAAALSGALLTLGLKYWRHLPGLPSSIILADGL